MRKEYWYVIITYLAMQFSGFIGLPLFMFIGRTLGVPSGELRLTAFAYWSIFSFLLALLLTLFFMRHDMKESALTRDKASISISAFWAICGVFLALFAQSIAITIEQKMGIQTESVNTQEILSVIDRIPLMIIVSSIIGPILEETIFRKIIFGSLYKRFNFFIAALISSVLFGLAHMEPEHLLLYSAMGFTFAFLYTQTKRILVPIIAHVSMNTLVVIMQMYSEDIQNFMKNMQAFIGGFL
ncbi:CPBP family intramembrane metalloprotease [Peribacillus asahii]|uniref:CPBP family intramembrane metalloprotease n=1 Tax=Peribacillus asahii TaxID=228899 RepID=A0A398B254_9BACI|nr:CPBP family intramembrane glutamic endopeptidase [Peribacillus asahii]RID82968.1 CPBP family intramembrane metalloprotease [Peribacillus asahii]